MPDLKPPIKLIPSVHLQHETKMINFAVGSTRVSKI